MCATEHRALGGQGLLKNSKRIDRKFPGFGGFVVKINRLTYYIKFGPKLFFLCVS